MFRTHSAALALCAVAASLAVCSTPASAQVQPLKASFTATPDEPVPGESVALHATTTGGSPSAPIEHAWDLDDDGAFDDASGPDATVAFPAEGDHVVRLRARQIGASLISSIAERTFTVRAPSNPAPPPPPPPVGEPQNQPPVARYDRICRRLGTLRYCSGLSAEQGKTKRLDASQSSDPDGQIVRYEWDLDGDGTFERDTGATPHVEHVFEPRPVTIGGGDPRRFELGVRVTDDRGATAEDRFPFRVVPAACEQVVRRGTALVARGTCLRPANATVDGKQIVRWVSHEPITLNGIAITPRSKWVTLELPRNNSGFDPRVRASNVEVSMNTANTPAVVSTGAIDWRVVQNRLQGFQAGADAKVNGLRITGVAGPPAVGFGRATAKVYVALPQQFGGATSGEPITLGGAAQAAQAGKPLSFTVPHAALGPIGLQKLKVSYDGVDLWEIEAAIALPPPADITVEGSAGIRSNGDFHHAAANVDFGSGLPIGGPIPVYLKRIKFRVEVNPKKSECVPIIGKHPNPAAIFSPSQPKELDFGIPTFALCGEVGLTGGPTILGAAAVGLDAGMGFATYDDRPWVLRAYGSLKVVEIEMAKGELAVHGDGYVRLQGRYRFDAGGVFEIKGGMGLELRRTKFNATASGDACIRLIDVCAGFRGIVSTKGIGVCLVIDLAVTEWSPGVGYRWGDSSPDIYFAGCDVGNYKEHLGARTAQAGGEQTLDLPAGLPGAVIAVEGRDAPPKVTFIGPGGERIETPDGMAVPKPERFIMLKDPRLKVTSVAIPKPSGGRWRIVTEPGSSPVVGLKSAEGLPEPDVKATVRGTGHRRTLQYRLTPRKGQKVTFVERGPSAGKQVGIARGATGNIRFAPADGAAERRQIVALVEQDGMMRDEKVVATYAAPAARKPSRPGRLRAHRRGARIGLRWASVASAARYDVRVRLSDGRSIVRHTRKPKLVIRAVSRRNRATVQVRAISASGLVGKAVSARVKSARRRG